MWINKYALDFMCFPVKRLTKMREEDSHKKPKGDWKRSCRCHIKTEEYISN